MSRRSPLASELTVVAPVGAVGTVGTVVMAPVGAIGTVVMAPVGAIGPVVMAPVGAIGPVVMAAVGAIRPVGAVGGTEATPGSNNMAPARNHAPEAAATILIMVPTLRCAFEPNGPSVHGSRVRRQRFNARRGKLLHRVNSRPCRSDCRRVPCGPRLRGLDP